MDPASKPYIANDLVSLHRKAAKDHRTKLAISYALSQVRWHGMQQWGWSGGLGLALPRCTLFKLLLARLSKTRR